jgi:uncharacterized protein YjbI with pentapeptide repeats
VAKKEQLNILAQGVRMWNAWRKDHAHARIGLMDAQLRGANLTGANLRDADLRGADLRDTNLSGLGPDQKSLLEIPEMRHQPGADLDGADLTGANLAGADLQAASLRNARLGNADLGGANLSYGYLDHALLFNANLSGANLLAAHLSGASLKGANLNGATLTDADLSGARLQTTDLRGANLTNAALVGAEFIQSNVQGTDFQAAELLSTGFMSVDLSAALNLHGCQHLGPSFVDSHTLLMSRPGLESFWRGCGVPNEIIQMLQSLEKRPIPLHSCFISYSSQDQEFAERLHADLQANNVRCWYAPHDARGGRKLLEQIKAAIQAHDKLLLVLSEASMGSDWVKTEIATARERELRENRRVLFPLRLVEFAQLRDWEWFDSDTGKDSAREIREYFVRNFSNWKDGASYREAFAALLRDLERDTPS